jgi:hypothetical protein
VRQYHKYFILLFLLVTACSSGDEKPVDIGRDYLPGRVGIFQVYNVDRTEYSEVADPVEAHYELMTEVVDSFPDVNDEYTYVIHRSTRANSGDDWEYLDTWSVGISDQEAIVNEENIAYVKIRFPVLNNRQWNGNEFNVSEPDTYEMESVEEPFTIDDQTYAKTITIEQEDSEDLLFKDKRLEVYAKDIGLIYREITDLNYCDDVDCFGQKEIKSGIIYKQSIISHGIN